MDRIGGAAADDPPLRGSVVRLRFSDATGASKVEAHDPAPAHYNFILGNDPLQWRLRVPAYREIVYHDLWPGVDFVLRQEDDGLAYECRARAGAAAPTKPFVFEGVSETIGRGTSEIRMRTSTGEIVQSVGPRDDEGESRGRFTFRREASGVREKNGSLPGEKDNPGALVWGALLGAGNDERAFAVEWDFSPAVMMGGFTASADFPNNGSGDNTFGGGGRDGFLATYEADGFTLAHAFVGGNGFDQVESILGADGELIAIGTTNSTNFPVTSGAFDPTHNGGFDAFMVRLNLDLIPVWSTYLGGSQDDSGIGIEWASGPDFYVACTTGSSNFPVTAGVFDPTHNANQDAVVCRFNYLTQQMIWSTFVGGGGSDYVSGLATGPDGRPVIVGETYSFNFPVMGGFDQTFSSPDGDGFVLKLNETGTAAIFGTFLGGSSNDWAASVVIDGSGKPVVCGSTRSADFPVTAGAHDTSYNPGGSSPYDGFVCKLSATGAQMLWGTFLGGADADYLYAVDLLPPFERPVVAGGTQSPDMPTTPDGFDTTPSLGPDDGYVVVLAPNGSTVLWASYVGGAAADAFFDAKVDEDGLLVLAGDTSSPDYPATPGSHDWTYNGGFDATVVRMQMPSAADGPDAPVLHDPSLTTFRALGLPGAKAVFEYALSSPAQVTLEVFDASGREINARAHGRQEAGTHRISWAPGASVVPGGVYFARLRADGKTTVTRFVIVR